MSKLYPHFCGNCSSKLVLENESSIFVCLSCGNAYDYDYFPEDSLIDEAEELRKNADYESARMSYSFLLYKEHNNALALRGHLLCQLQARHTSNLVGSNFKFNPKTNYNYYIEESPSEYRGYFSEVKTLSLLSEKRGRLEKKLMSYARNQNQLDDILKPYQDTAEADWTNEPIGYTKTGDPIPRMVGLIMIITTVILCVLALIHYIPKLSEPNPQLTSLAAVVVASLLCLLSILYFISLFASTVSGKEEARYILSSNRRNIIRTENALNNAKYALKETKDLQQLALNKATEIEQKILIDFDLFEKLNQSVDREDETDFLNPLDQLLK